MGVSSKKGQCMPASHWPAWDRPTPRELQVLELICDGCATKQVAAHLGITVKTVACHRLPLLQKAGAQTAVGLFRWAITKAYVTVSPAELQDKSAFAPTRVGL